MDALNDPVDRARNKQVEEKIAAVNSQ